MENIIIYYPVWAKVFLHFSHNNQNNIIIKVIRKSYYKVSIKWVKPWLIPWGLVRKFGQNWLEFDALN